MKVKVLLNDSKFVTSYAVIGDILGSVDAEIDQNELDDFFDNFSSYYFNEGTLLKDADKQSQREKLEKLEQLRLQRRTECFPVVNRGKLWYDMLTEEQLTELNSWYASWLDVTETEVIPSMPQWIAYEEI